MLLDVAANRESSSCSRLPRPVQRVTRVSNSAANTMSAPKNRWRVCTDRRDGVPKIVDPKSHRPTLAPTCAPPTSHDECHPDQPSLIPVDAFKDAPAWTSGRPAASEPTILRTTRSGYRSPK